MPLIKRLTYDMIGDCTPWCDILVNPVNCHGVAGAGLALAFKEYCYEQYQIYRKACIEKRLTMGKLHIFYNEKDNNIIVNLPTKNHFADLSNLDDIELGLQKLVTFLKLHPFKTVALPMLGAGLGKLAPNLVYTLFEKYLDSLPNTIFVCMRPDSFKQPPNYLVVGGSRKFTDYKYIEEGIQKGLQSFGLNFSDFEKGISGGASGVDIITAGTGIDSNKKDISIFEKHNLPPVVCHADWKRYQKSAGFIRNKTLLEAGTHFVLFIGSRSVGTRMMKDLIDKHNHRADEIYKKECILDHVKNFDFPMEPTKTWKKLYTVDISNICE